MFFCSLSNSVGIAAIARVESSASRAEAALVAATTRLVRPLLLECPSPGREVVRYFFFSNPHSFVARQLKPNQNTQATCSKQPCLSCAGNPLLTPANSPAAAAAAAVAAAASAAETEHRIYLRSHRQRRNQQLLQIQQQQQQQQVANLTLRPWTRSRAQQVLHHYQLEQLHPSHTGTTPTTKTINNYRKRLDSRLFCLNRCRLFD